MTVTRDNVLEAMLEVGRWLGCAAALDQLELGQASVIEALSRASGLQRQLADVDPVAGRVALERIHAFMHGDPIEGTVIERVELPPRAGHAYTPEVMG